MSTEADMDAARHARVRAQLEADGLLKPKERMPDPPVRTPMRTVRRTGDGPRSLGDAQQVDHLARQLYNVFRGKMNTLPDYEDDQWETWEEMLKSSEVEAFRAQALYVLSTYRENDALKAEIRTLKVRLGE